MVALIQRLKGPDHMAEGGHHLRNRTQPPPTFHIAETLKELLESTYIFKMLPRTSKYPALTPPNPGNHNQPGPTFIKPGQLDPWIKDQIKIILLSFRNCRGKIVDSRAFPSWSLIHGSSWSGLIKEGPGIQRMMHILLCCVLLWLVNH